MNICETVIDKMLTGGGLPDDEKDHLAGCEHCMKTILEALDRRRKAQGHSPESLQSRPAAQRALERARKIFQREFGVTLGEDAPASPEKQAS